MGTTITTTPLRQFLISLCNDTHWKYSVFWKLKHQTPLILTWEDGYYDDTKPEEAYEIKSSSVGASTDDFGTEEFPIGLVVANMSRFQYAFGEGLVGEVAYTGNHMWVSVNSFFSREFESKLVPDWTDKWLLQIASGIKTILLVPAFPDGVIQLGSLEEVAENLAAVRLVKERFESYRKMMETIHFTSTSTLPHSSLSCVPVENIHASTCHQVKYEKSEDFDNDEMDGQSFSTPKQSAALQTVQDVFRATGKKEADGFETTSDHGIGFFRESICPSLSLSGNNTEIVPNMFEFSCSEEELLPRSLSGDQSLGFLDELLNGVNRYPFGDMEIQLFGSDRIDEGEYQSMDGLYRFHEGSELHKALGLALQDNTYENLQGGSFLVDDAFTNESSGVRYKDLADIDDPSWLARGTDSEDLLQAVIANLFSRSSEDPSSSSPSYSGPSCTTSLRKSSSFSQEVPKTEDRSDHCGLAGPSVFARVDSSASLDGMASTLTHEGSPAKGHARAPSKKSPNVKTSCAKKGNGNRPRPRDRQLIQDRVTELRELVPNGSKCSIDGLLDRTIKHMMYLSSVADQAEKLKGLAHQELASSKNRKSSESNGASQNGASWAFECGTKNPVCPIVVEDLEFPGHMLIKVSCDDHGLFLEIAQLIRQLDLIILKGSMENHSSKTWAQFVVEATKGFHRTEIFWPILHLLQRKRSRVSSCI